MTEAECNLVTTLTRSVAAEMACIVLAVHFARDASWWFVALFVLGAFASHAAAQYAEKVLSGVADA